MSIDKEMHAKGMVTIAELAVSWGKTYNLVAYYQRSGRIRRGVKAGNRYYFPKDTPMPDRAYLSGNPKSGSPKTLQDYVNARHRNGREVKIEQVPLECSWAMWKAPSSARSFGWLGASA